MSRKALLRMTGFGLALLLGDAALAQQPPGPPAVGVVTAARKSVVQASEYTGRIQAINRVNLVARVTAFLDQVLFAEGTEVKQGDLLYRLEQAPFKADVQAKEASVAQFKAQLRNAQIVLERAQTLLRTPAGQQAAVDTATAAELALQAQVMGAEAQLLQSRINLDYTEIRAPIDGKIGRTAVTAGNYVATGTGTLTSIVSQDPMYVVFAVSTRAVVDLQTRSAAAGKAPVIRIRMSDGKPYDAAGTLDFVDNAVTGNTDTITLRGKLPNPKLGSGSVRPLVDGALVTVVLEDAQPVEALTVPRAAVLSDQQGDYVYVVGEGNKAEQRRVQLGRSTPADAAVTSGLKEGDSVIVDGIQRVRPGQPVAPGAAAARPQVPATATQAPATR